MPNSPGSFSEFWPRYVLAHRDPLTRAFHFVGTLVGWVFFVSAFLFVQWRLLAAALVVPYGLAWFSHFIIERNRPATFAHPLWSWLADQKMVALVFVGKMEEEVRRCAAGD